MDKFILLKSSFFTKFLAEWTVKERKRTVSSS